MNLASLKFHLLFVELLLNLVIATPTSSCLLFPFFLVIYLCHSC